MMGSSDRDGRLQGRAREILRENDTGRWTVPSKTQYPHQWNWDSAFSSLGWATFDWQRATVEIESLIAGRWREGMLPHTHYDAARLGDYFPGPDRWTRAQSHVAVPGEMTSGISNPPLIVSAAYLVGLRAPDPASRTMFWRRVFGDLREYLFWFVRDRSLPSSPLPVMVHPWESGWDNSPRWDHVAAARLRPRHPFVRRDTEHVDASQRPRGAEYDTYLALIELLEDVDYDVREYVERSPFAMYDVVIDSLWFRAARDLNRIAAALGGAPIPSSLLDRFRQAFDEVHWDEELSTYLDWDCIAGQRVRRVTAAGLAALAGGLVPAERGRRVWYGYRRLEGDAIPVCSTPPTDPAYDPVRYWRGPVWSQLNWLVALGLDEVELGDEAAALRRRTLSLIADAGFAEYFDSRTGAPAGAQEFGWTAAVALELIAGGTSPGEAQTP